MLTLSARSFRNFDYISQRKSNVYTRRHHNLASIPSELDRKAYLLRYFEDYMAKTLRRDVPWTFEDVERKKNMDFLVKYYRMKNAIVFKMSNDVLQVRSLSPFYSTSRELTLSRRKQFNFYDHTKLIITSLGQTLTFIDPSFTLTTYSLQTLFELAAQYGHYDETKGMNERDKERLEKVRYLLGKVEYCKDVLKTLSLRKLNQQQAKEGAKEKEGAGKEEAK